MKNILFLLLPLLVLASGCSQETNKDETKPKEEKVEGVLAQEDINAKKRRKRAIYSNTPNINTPLIWMIV